LLTNPAAAMSRSWSPVSGGFSSYSPTAFGSPAFG
jgi:hypothetical protein